MALELCQADSAGISSLETDRGKPIFRWYAIAGEFEPYRGGVTPRDFSPCGVVLDRNAPQLIAEPVRYYPYIAELSPHGYELLLIPFYRGDIAIGTVWVVASHEARRFDAEDSRVMTNLSLFASAAVQALTNLDAIEESAELERQLVSEAAALNAKFSAFFEQGPLFAGIMAVDGTIIEANRISWEGCGYTKDQIVGKPFWECPWWAPSVVLAERIKAASAQGNLLNNAARYSENGGTIHLSAADEGGDVVIRVKATGIGIAPEKLSAMFELFMQGDRSSGRSEGGLGIGLTLVKKLVELQGGTITSHSEGLGKGSEFVIRLPASSRPLAVLPPANTADVGVTSARILVVDDDIDTTKGLARLLGLLGHAVETAHTGSQAIEAARAFRPEVILLDLGLPGLDGYEVAQRL